MGQSAVDRWRCFFQRLPRERARSRPSRFARRDHSVDALIAGCGTGQQSIQTAQTIPDAKILAVDLSAASLAYAKRKDA
jgi:ubiquinone/menaquinone biosynthesis C-methylase UbiE